VYEQTGLMYEQTGLISAWIDSDKCLDFLNIVTLACTDVPI